MKLLYNIFLFRNKRFEFLLIVNLQKIIGFTSSAAVWDRFNRLMIGSKIININETINY